MRRSTLIALLVMSAAIALLFWSYHLRSRPLASVLLSDGRILHIEKVSYGTRHRIGRSDYKYFYWVPSWLRGLLSPASGESTLDLPAPALVLWVDATDARTGKYADAQKTRLEFVDRHGELWGEQSRNWNGFVSGYSRVAFGFTCFPRDEETLTLRLTPWHNSPSSLVKIKNPQFVAPSLWKGLPLPQRQTVDGFEIVLTKLTPATNGLPREYWATPVRYWDPSWQLRRAALPVNGWDGPEWEAEDPLGNKGTTPNVRQPVLRFSAAFYPSPTNLEATLVAATPPQIDLTSPAANQWNSDHRFQSREIDALGFFPSGMHVFVQGQYTNYNPGLRPPTGGAPSGWTGWSMDTGMKQVVTYNGHYTPFPVIYLRYQENDSIGRVALRFHDQQGHNWMATPEPDGNRDNVHPFMLPPPTGVKRVTPEIVWLKPLQASFLVAAPPPPP